MHRPVPHTPQARRLLAQSAPFAATIAALTGALLLAGCGRETAAQASGAAADITVPVRVTPLDGSDAPQASALQVSGTLAGKEEVALAFKIGGVISRIAVDPGQRVRTGQVLAELRPTEIAAQVSSAREAQRKAQRDLERVTKLYADSVTTLEQLQDARTALEVASNTVRAAQFNADYAVIRAPGDGVLLSRTAEPGQVVEPGRPVLSVRRNGRGMVVKFGLPDRDIVAVHLGDDADVTFDAVPGTHFPARVTERAAAATPATGDYAVEVTLGAAAQQLPTGLVAHVALQRPVARTASASRIRVPLDALVDADADSAAVFVLSADRRTVSRRPVKLADVAEALQTAMVPVVAGLSGREVVVIAGTSRLVDGTKVTVITTPAQRAASDAAPAAKAAP